MSDGEEGMLVAVLSDAHGNRIFFDKIIREIDITNPDRIIFLGDAFGYMDGGKDIYEALKRRNAMILKGNHEAMLVGEQAIDDNKDKVYGLKKQREKIDNHILSELKELPTEITMEIGGSLFSFMHGAPFDVLKGYLYENNAEYDWENTDYDYIFMGHTHRMYRKKVGKITYVNVGSCGLPRDIGLSPGYCILDTEAKEVHLRRINLDKSILEDEFFDGINEDIQKVFLRREFNE